MSYPSAQRGDHVTSLARTREELAKLKGQDFVRTDMRDTSRFPEAPIVAARLFATDELLSRAPLDALPAMEIRALATAFGNAVSALTRIREWDGHVTLKGGEAHEAGLVRHRNELMEALDKADGELYQRSLMLLPTAAGSAWWEESAERTRRAAQEAEAALKRVENIETAARDAASKTAVGTNADFFRARASAHTRAAWFWMVGVGVSCIIAVSAAKWAIDESRARASDASQAFGPFAVLLLTLSGALSLVIWTTRMYRSCLHNAVVNQHRDDALRTFRAFVEGVQDDAALRNAVLVQATQCVFQPQDTGYGGSSAPAAPQIQLLELIKSGDK